MDVIGTIPWRRWMRYVHLSGGYHDRVKLL